jgi:hypothetical protein
MERWGQQVKKITNYGPKNIIEINSETSMREENRVPREICSSEFRLASMTIAELIDKSGCWNVAQPSVRA